MQTAIATVCLSGTLNEKLEAIAAARFKGVEIFENDLLSFDGTPTQVGRRIKDLGLAAVTFQPFRDFEGMPEPLRTKAFARAERKFDLMAELGCDLLMICSNVSPDSLGGIDRAAADFRELGERAARRGLRVAFEALAWGRHISDYRDAWEVVRRADHPAVGLVLDSFHVLARGTDLNAIRAIPKERIFLVQVADAPKLNMDYLSWSRHYRCFPGQGEFAIDAFMDALQATGFDGLVSLEIFNDSFRAGSARYVAIDGQRSLLVMLDELRQRTGTPVKGLPQLPPRAHCRGIDFIEFALDEAAAATFETALGALGFVKAGVHKSKVVTRWRQADINLVVNCDKEGFAHSFNITHGSAVCAMALKVDNAAATLSRAAELLDLPFRQVVRTGEIDIPAVRGLGGSLLYFTDDKTDLGRHWEIDFDASPSSGNGTDARIIAYGAAASSPSPLVGEGRGGGSRVLAPEVPAGTTPTPDPSSAETPPYPPPQAGEGREGAGSATRLSDRNRQQPISIGGGEPGAGATCDHAGCEAGGAGLIAFDHVSQSMQHEEMLTWLLFYTSLLAVQKTPVQDVLDPGGIVHSQVVETTDGAFRLVLNASQSRQTLSSRFLTELFGSGVQHIAFATSDIFATAKRLGARGVELLAIPENYYDDLDVRFDFPPGALDRLRANNILYDHQGAGEYFQLYTKTFDGGFFFEIVERRAYAGFGAANAAIRLAAQTRLVRDPVSLGRGS